MKFVGSFCCVPLVLARLATVLLGLVAIPCLPAIGASQAIVLASTTSVQDSGLLDNILPIFTAATGIEVKVVAQGTGMALATAARGDADLVLVHDPDAEARFVESGNGVERREIAWNDFIVVGPDSDPAKVRGGHDVSAAFRAIFETRSTFISRGDNSGTNAAERRLWTVAGVNPAIGSSSWYRDIGAGMGAALNAAAATGGYTLTDRGTWVSFGNRSHMILVLEGDPRLINIYDTILVNPTLHPDVNNPFARKLADWLASAEGQSAIGGYVIDGQQLFHPRETKPVHDVDPANVAVQR